MGNTPNPTIEDVRTFFASFKEGDSAVAVHFLAGGQTDQTAMASAMGANMNDKLALGAVMEIIRRHRISPMAVIAAMASETFIFGKPDVDDELTLTNAPAPDENNS